VSKKKIKTFSVDEEIYNSLVSMLKESGVEVSLSYFVDKCLKGLYNQLKDIEKERQESDAGVVPMSFYINSIVRSELISTFNLQETLENNVFVLKGQNTGKTYYLDLSKQKILAQMIAEAKERKK
jgi:hypothetical protein